MRPSTMFGQAFPSGRQPALVHRGIVTAMARVPTTDPEKLRMALRRLNSGDPAMITLARTLVAGVMVAAVAACAASKPVPAPMTKAEATPAWPDDWGIQFALRCVAAGNDARFCTCVADEIKKRWTPDEFKSVRPEALQDETRRCRERLRLDDGS